MLFVAVQLVGGSQADHHSSSLAVPGFQGTWTVDNRCRAIYLPAILRRKSGAGASRTFSPALPSQGSRLTCIQISDADLAQIEWDAVVEIYARQANRNREALDMVPLGTWGR
jgi:hypothetical protein